MCKVLEEALRNTKAFPLGLHVDRTSPNSGEGPTTGEKFGKDAVSWFVQDPKGRARQLAGTREPLGILGRGDHQR